MPTTQEWIDELKSISVLELSERIKALEEEFGVSATAVAAAAPAAGMPAAAGDGGVAADEGEGGRALEELLELLGACLVGGASGEAVLDDLETGVGVGQRRPQLHRLLHGDAAVVHREDRRSVLDL